MAIEAPEQGFAFWPVGNGDSTTVFVDQRRQVQIDINHFESSEAPDDPHAPVIDELIEILPTKDGRPYLPLFVLTHPDQDHCRGFPRLLDEVTIGEVWFSPRVFDEYPNDLCDDAVAFRTECWRRVNATIAAPAHVGAGDRVRIIGYSDVLDQPRLHGFPKERLTIPGSSVSDVDGEDWSHRFRAFIHAPFKDDQHGDRNDTSIGMQVALTCGANDLTALLLGDLKYPRLRRIFDVSEDDDLRWDILLAPHHCSKSVMYWKGAHDEEEVRRPDIMDDLERTATDQGCIVSSSEPIPTNNEPGDNPPHALAKKEYGKIVPQDFLCTQENGSGKKAEPIVFELEDNGAGLRGASATLGAVDPQQAVAAARGRQEAPPSAVGFG